MQCHASSDCASHLQLIWSILQHTTVQHATPRTAAGKPAHASHCRRQARPLVSTQCLAWMPSFGQGEYLKGRSPRGTSADARCARFFGQLMRQVSDNECDRIISQLSEKIWRLEYLAGTVVYKASETLRASTPTGFYHLLSLPSFDGGEYSVAPPCICCGGHRRFIFFSSSCFAFELAAAASRGTSTR